MSIKNGDCHYSLVLSLFQLQVTGQSPLVLSLQKLLKLLYNTCI